MSKKLKKRVPELRFFEFKGSCDWKQNKLKNITQKIGSGATPTGGDSNYKESGISLFRSLNVYDGLFKSENLAFIDENQAKRLDNVTPKNGDILFNITGASIARCCIAPTELLPARVNQHVMIIRPNPKDIKTEFLALILIHHSYKKKLFQLGGKGGSTREALTKEHIEQFEILYPSIAEQEKIASFLGAVDRRLTQLRRKQELLQTYKRGVMQKIFSQQIRFTQPDGSPFPNWESKKLGQFAPLQRGFDLPVDNIVEGQFPVVFSNGILKRHYEYKVTSPGVVTGRSGTIGKVMYIEENFWPHNTSLWVTDFKGNLPRFVYYFYIWLDLTRFSSGSGVPTLNRNDVHTYSIYFPLLQEQEKIANFLTAIDRKIEILSRQIEQTEKFKKGLLQKLFI